MHFLFIIFIIFSGCSHLENSSKFKQRNVASDFSSDQLDDNKFEPFAKEQNFQSYVKFVIFTDANNLSIRFFDSNKYPLHVNYLKTEAGVTESIEDIYKSARFNQNRKYFFGALIKTNIEAQGPEPIRFQFTSTDTVSSENIIKINNLILQKTSLSKKLNYLPSGNQAPHAYNPENLQTLEGAGVVLYRTNEQKYNIYSENYTVGILKIVNAEDITSGAYKPKENEILVLNYMPDSLTPVRGVITSNPSSPNSHVALLADMLSIPFMHINNANQIDEFRNLNGKKVFFKPFSGRAQYLDRPFTLMKVTDAVYSKLDSALKGRFPTIPLVADANDIESFKSFPSLSDSQSQISTGTCGAKAKNGKILNQVLGEKNSLFGICVPFFYYDTFLLKNPAGNISLKKYILTKIETLSGSVTLEQVQETLDKIQTKIMAAKIDPSSLKAIRNAVLKEFEHRNIKKIRIRSSSNAEDDERFNGAGLYESDGIKLKHFKEENYAKIEESIKTVWKSVYGFRAFMARKQFHMDETKVYMGLLINQSFKENARGVSVCSPYRDSIECRTEGFPGGDLKVTHPPKGKLSEISHMTDSWYRIKQPTTELPQQEKILLEEEYLSLVKLMEKVYVHWKDKINPGFNGKLDFEWKRMSELTGNKNYMILKQVREVPKPLGSGINEPIYMIDPNRIFYSDLDILSGIHYGPLRMVNFRHFKVNIPPSTSFSNLEDSSASINFIISDYLSKNKNIYANSVKNSESNWEQASDEVHNKTFNSEISLNYPKLPKLEINFSYNQSKNDEQILSDNLITIDSLEISSNIHKSAFPYWSDSQGVALNNKYNSKYRLEKKKIVKNPQTRTFCKDSIVVAKVIIEESPKTTYMGDGSYPFKSMTIKKSILPGNIESDLEINRTSHTLAEQNSHADVDFPIYEAYTGYIPPEDAIELNLGSSAFFVFSRYGNETTSDNLTIYDNDRNLLHDIKLDKTCPN